MNRILTFFLSCLFLLAATVNAQWTDGQNATYVIGQPNFTTGTSGNETQGLNQPYRVAIDLANNKLYVADNNNHRVLRYSYPITSNQPTAELVFGQANFTSVTANRGGAVAANTMNRPRGIAVYNGTLWVADVINNRVLKFNNAHSQSSNGSNADVVLGQSSFTASGTALAQDGMNNPTSLAIDSSGNLWVGDYINNRVLRFNNAAAKSSGATADGLLGQTTFIVGNATTSTTATRTPSGVAVSTDGRLWVAEVDNNRVTRFDNAATKTNGAAADGVLGQSLYTTNSAATTQSGMNNPRDVAVSPAGRLFIAIGASHRVIIQNNAASKSNGAAADNVLGQPDFTSNSSALSQNGMTFPVGVAITPDGKLFVSELSGSANRVTMFEGPDDTPLPVELVDFTLHGAANNISLRWKTASEVNNAGFEVYRSSGSENSFQKIASYIINEELRGLGTNPLGKSYSFKDIDVTAGEHFYRLVDVAFDGTRKEHEQKSILVRESGVKNLALEISPNPANEFLKVKYTLADPESVTLEIYSLTGEKIYTIVPKEAGDVGIQEVNIPLADMVQGSYTLHIITKEGVSTEGFTVVW